MPLTLRSAEVTSVEIFSVVSAAVGYKVALLDVILFIKSGHRTIYMRCISVNFLDEVLCACV